MAKQVQIELDVVGIRYRVSEPDAWQIQQYLDEGLPVECDIVHEPYNEFDSNALKVIIKNEPFKLWHLGYIPRSMNQPILERMKKGGKIVKASLQSIDDDLSAGKLLVTIGQKSLNLQDKHQG